jgi:hypothetical protein
MKTNLKVLAIALIGITKPLIGATTPITSGFTGAWYDPTRFGQGIQMQIVESAGQQAELLVYWYTYDQSGRPLWLIGQTPITSANAERVSLNMSSVSGPRFMQNGAPAALQAFGQIEVAFSDCNTGEMRFNTPSGAGTATLRRITSTYGQSCTGTLIDDRRPTDTSEQNQTIAVGTGILKSRYRETPNQVSFKVEVEGLSTGTYVLSVDGVMRAPITVTDTTSGTHGEVEFRSPSEVGRLPLNFDPRGKTLQILRNGTLIGGGNGSSTGSGVNGAPPFGNLTRTVELTANNSLASGDAKLKQQANQVSFSVEIEDVALGNYELFIGATRRGQIIATMQNGQVKGELEFQSPVEPGKQLLNFDPRGQRIEVRNASGVVLFGQFPN